MRTYSATIILALINANAAAQKVDNSGNGTAGINFNNTSQCQTPQDGPLFFPQAREIKPPGISFFIILTIAYIFWALAYVVERVLVPSMHVGIAKRVKLPASVAGASLLALGGCSVPLFFINIYSLTQEPASATGFGMVLGSGAFNMLFVLPVCYFAGAWDATPLHWWPLFRDLFVYLVAVVLVLVFFLTSSTNWVTTENERNDMCWTGHESICCYQELVNDRVQPRNTQVLLIWEGITLIVVYILYITLLRNHNKVKWALESLCCCSSSETKLQKQKRYDEAHDHKKQLEAHTKSKQPTNKTLFQTITECAGKHSPATQRACSILVLRAPGGAKHTFDMLLQVENAVLEKPHLERFVRANKTSILDKAALKLDNPTDIDIRIEKIAQEMYKEIAGGGSKKGVEYAVFEEWYTKAEALAAREVNAAFDLLDESSNGEVSVSKLEPMIELLGSRPSKHIVRKVRDKLEINGKGCIGRGEFIEWYRASMAKTESPQTSGQEFQESKDTSVPVTDLWGKEDGEFPEIYLWDPEGSAFTKASNVVRMPVTLLVFLTTCAWTGQAEKLSFCSALWWLLMSVIWLAFLSWVLFYLSESLGLTLGIPHASLGSSVLAIGVNIPHFISSIYRAKRMSGDHYNILRSVELSLKGNLFDILIGLPCAWIIASLAKSRPVFLGANNLDTSLYFLALTVLLTLFLLKCASWELGHVVAINMVLLFVVFILQDLLLADWVKTPEPYVLCDGCSSGHVCIDTFM